MFGRLIDAVMVRLSAWAAAVIIPDALDEEWDEYERGMGNE